MTWNDDDDVWLRQTKNNLCKFVFWSNHWWKETKTHMWRWIHVCTVSFRMLVSSRPFTMFCFSVCWCLCRIPDVQWFCQTCNIIHKALRWKVIFSGWDEKAPLSLAFIRFRPGSIKSVWHSSAPLCIVQLRSVVVIPGSRRLILVRHRPCPRCRRVNGSRWFHKKTLCVNKKAPGSSNIWLFGKKHPHVCLLKKLLKG